jgi:hypothetical protein
MHGHMNVKFLVFIFSAVREEGLYEHSMLSCGLSRSKQIVCKFKLLAYFVQFSGPFKA